MLLVDVSFRRNVIWRNFNRKNVGMRREMIFGEMLLFLAPPAFSEDACGVTGTGGDMLRAS